jgi:hypothetical protein
MKEPTLEDLRKERNQYRAHLDKGGKPITLTLILTPGDDTLDWGIKGDFPKELSHLTYTLMFVSYIRDQVNAAVQPDKIEQGRN